MTPKVPESEKGEGQRLTRAQREALKVLAEADGPVRGWRQATIREGQANRHGYRQAVSHINMRAAASLCEAGLAKRHLSERFNPFAHTDTYVITDAGRAALEPTHG